MSTKNIILLVALFLVLGIGATCGLGGCKGGGDSDGGGTGFQPVGGGLTLPPDPGEAGKVTLAGIDSDGNGVRDDVQRYIALTYPNSERTRAGLTQYAKEAQQALLDADDEETSITNARNRQRALECLRYILGGVDAASIIREELTAEFLNTDARSRAWIVADGQLSGQIFRGTPIAERKAQCSFDPDAMEN